MREIIKEARNVDEAIELACKDLGVERDTIEFEIINLPKRGFLGFRNTLAKVRVYIEEPVKPEPRIVQSKPAPRQNAVEKNVNFTSKPASKPPQRQEIKPAPQSSQTRAESGKKPPEAFVPPVQLKFISADIVEGKPKTAADYVKSVLAEMGVAAEISVATTESGIVLRLSGDGLGVIIGRRGETLDSLQYLAGLVANRQEGDYMRVTIDSGNYREKRERTLEQLAQKLSASAIRYSRASTLEPMNPYERRIIHATVSQIEGVTSTSIGEEPNRRVVITPQNVKQPSRSPRPANKGTRPSNGAKPLRRNDNRPAEVRSNENGSTQVGGGQAKPVEGRSTENRAEPRPQFRPNDRQPRRDNRPKPSFNRENAGENKPTSTAVDREYAREIEREASAFVKAEPTEKPIVRENTAPSRTEAPKEAADLPLYGKIEL